MSEFLVPASNALSNYFRLGATALRIYEVDRLGLRQAFAKAMVSAYRGGFQGCFIDSNDADHDLLPDWVRRIARYEHDRFQDESPTPNVSQYCSGLLPGKGKRTCLWNLALKLDPLCFKGSQNYGNCTAASLNWEGLNLLSAVQILGLKEPIEFRAPYGTALIYGARGHSGAGMALSTAANAATQLGTQTRSLYCNDKYDLRKEDTDERYGNDWGRRGPPDDIVAETRLNPVRTVSYVDDASEQFVYDVLQNGGFVHTGATYTARETGDPISSLQRIGGHAQSVIGYDDTDEFRDWYHQVTANKLNEGVMIFGQTWGQWNTVHNWPSHLWGPYPEGSWVVKASDGMKLVRSDAYVYSATTGFAPADIDWSMI